MSGNQLVNAALVDFYGGTNPQPNDQLPPGGIGSVTFPPGDNGPDITWQSTMAGIDGLGFFQFRATFVSNTQSGLTSELTSIGFAYED